ncbi:MAG: thiamine pyrophosphate-binding protein [Chloroflexi bacterium]|nr:thiamine pyrophosphate-binding protein [Chloroflexota bacterium]MBV9600823.1 thiamine pyrophosphate-binding protein [Chloroflexota bacterium]
MTGGDALARQLAREGIRDIFGVPGVQLDYAVDGLARLPATSPIAYWNTRHEQATSYMADGYSRSTGRIGTCMVVPGPGLLNALAGVSTAYACSSRVLCISGQIPSDAIGRGLGLLHEIPDQSRILGTLTKWSARAESPRQVAPLVHEAVHQLRSGRPRPVGLEIPPDVLQATAEVSLLEPVAHDEPLAPDPAAVVRGARLLASAERPVIYAGGGAVAGNASQPLRRLAELLQCPVVMSPNGRGALDDRHPLALTWLAGRAPLSEADLVLGVGSRFLTGQDQLALAPGARCVLLNVEPGDLADPRHPDVAILGDAALGLSALCDELAGTGRSDGSGRRVWLDLDDVRRWAEDIQAQIEPQYSWVRALRAALPEDGILVNEFTQVGYMSQAAFPVYHPRSYISPGYQGTLGYGFPTALGARVANPDTPVLSISGDGGFGWGLSELSTARKFGIGLVTVVFNDQAYGNVRRAQVQQFDGRIFGSELLNPDFVDMAESFGVRGARATTPGELEGLLRETLGPAAEPVLIDVPVGVMPQPFRHLRESPVPKLRPAPLG